MEQTSNLKLPLINVNNAEDLKKTFIDFVKIICGVDDSSALQILDKAIQNLQTTKQDLLTAGENITIVNNVISGVGGVKEEDVLEIIENNAEQTETLEVENATEIGIGTSETFDPTSDEQIPTSKAVAEVMASAGGGSKLYEHCIKFTTKVDDVTLLSTVPIISNVSEPFTVDSLKELVKNNEIVICQLIANDTKIYKFEALTYSSSNDEVQVAVRIWLNSIEDNNVSFSNSSRTVKLVKINSDVVREL